MENKKIFNKFKDNSEEHKMYELLETGEFFKLAEF